MRIIDLDAEHESLFVHCLEEWSEEMKASGPHRACWVEKMKAQGLGAKLALDDAGVAGGMNIRQLGQNPQYKQLQ